MAQTNNAEKNDGHPSPGGREVEPRRRLRGFAAMDPETRRRVSSVGGKAAHEKGTAHEFTSDEAREAGRKGAHARGVVRAGQKQPSDTEPPAVIPFPNAKSSV